MSTLLDLPQSTTGGIIAKWASLGTAATRSPSATRQVLRHVKVTDFLLTR